MKNLRVIATALLALFIFSSAGDAWNISPHMVNGAITYQILQRDSPATIAMRFAVKIAYENGSLCGTPKGGSNLSPQRLSG